jgi:hypothetical protein
MIDGKIFTRSLRRAARILDKPCTPQQNRQCFLPVLLRMQTCPYPKPETWSSSGQKQKALFHSIRISLQRWSIGLFLFFLVVFPQAHAETTSFSYQGRLNVAGSPANGLYDLSFGLYPANIGGQPMGGILITNTLSVTNGLFVTLLDFGKVFDGTTYWLEIGVRTNGNGGFVLLTPRTPMQSTPYAQHAASASSFIGMIGDNQISNSIPRLNNVTNLFTGSMVAHVFVGDGAGLTNLPASTLANLGGITTNAMAQANTLIVSKSGNDNTGERGRLDKPFLTLSAAKAAAISGDTIIVMRGLYNDYDLLKNQVNWHFTEGATNRFTGDTTGIAYMFDDHGMGVTSSISGDGVFICANGKMDDYNGVLRTSSTNTVVTFKGWEIISDRDGADGLTELLHLTRIETCHQVNLDLRAIRDIRPNSAAVGLWWANGDSYATVDYIKGQLGYAVWGDEDTPYANYPPSNWYVTSKLIDGAVWYYPDTSQGKFWLEAQEIRGGDHFPAITYTVGLPNQGGKFYLTAQKVSNTSPSLPTFKFDGAIGGQSWIDVQKVSSRSCYIEGTGHTNHLNIGHFEQTGKITTGISLSGGEWYIRGNMLQATNSFGIVVNTNTAALISDYIITAQTPLFVSGSGLRLQNTILSTSPNWLCIDATNARTVGTYGVVANLPKSGNISNYPTNGLTIDSNVR